MNFHSIHITKEKAALPQLCEIAAKFISGTRTREAQASYGPLQGQPAAWLLRERWQMKKVQVTLERKNENGEDGDEEGRRRQRRNMQLNGRPEGRRWIEMKVAE